MIFFSERKEKAERIIKLDNTLNVKFGLAYNYDSSIVKACDLLLSISPSSEINFLYSSEIKSISFSDGVYDFANSYYKNERRDFSPDLYDPLYSDIHFSFGQKEADFISFLNPGKNVYAYTPAYLEKSKDRFLKSDEIMMNRTKKQFDFLITTANSAYFNEEEKDTLICQLNFISEQLTKLGYNVIFRLFDKDLIKSIRFVNVDNNFINCSLDSILNDVNCVITTPSTLIVEAMSFQLPVAQLFYRDTPIFIQSGWYINSILNVEKVAKSMIDREQSRMNVQNFELNNYFSESKDVSSIIIDEQKQADKYKQNIFSAEKSLLFKWYNINLKNIFCQFYKCVKKW